MPSIMPMQARASADIVLTEPGLSTIVDAIVIARRIFRRISNFLNYRIAATLQLLLFFFIAVFAFAPDHYNPKVTSCLLVFLSTAAKCCQDVCIWIYCAAGQERNCVCHLRRTCFNVCMLSLMGCTA